MTSLIEVLQERLARGEAHLDRCLTAEVHPTSTSFWEGYVCACRDLIEVAAKFEAVHHG